LRSDSLKAEKFITISHTKEARENAKICRNQGRRKYYGNHFLPSVSRGAWTTCLETAKVFFGKEEGCFSKSQATLLKDRYGEPERGE
jgi:hypothetical protein